MRSRNFGKWNCEIEQADIMIYASFFSESAIEPPAASCLFPIILCSAANHNLILIQNLFLASLADSLLELK